MAYNPNFTGRFPRDTYASVVNTDGVNIYNSTGSQLTLINVTASNAVSSSFTNQVLSASISDTSISASHALHADIADLSYAVNGTASWAINVVNQSTGSGTTLVTGSTYPITSSWSETASFALNSAVGGTTLFTGSTYDITSSWTNNVITASWAQNGLITASFYPISVSWAQNGIITASTYPITSSVSITASFALNGGTTILATGSTYLVTSSWAVSASWAPNLSTTAKAGIISASQWGSSFGVGDYITASVVFINPFPNTNYAVTFGSQGIGGISSIGTNIQVTGSLLAVGFTASLNQTQAIDPNINFFWMATSFSG